MSQYFTTETFFRPIECQRHQITLSAEVYNQCRLLLSHSKRDSVFVPIRSMQYLAVITNHEILFIDSLDYAVRDGEGGRLITIAWQTEYTGERLTLNEPVQIEVVYYKQGIEDIQRRLIGEFSRAMKVVQEREADVVMDKQEARVLPFKP